MALVNCKDCGALVSTGATVCLRCGARAPRRTSALGQFVAVLLALSLLLAVISLITNSYQDRRDAARKAADNAIIERGLRAAMSAEEYAAYQATVAAEAAAASRRAAAEAAHKREKETAISSAAADVRRLLRDADSAQFGRQHLYTNVNARLGITICGYVNAKNGFGGYTGDKGYIVVDRRAQIEDGSDAFASTWNKLCK